MSVHKFSAGDRVSFLPGRFDTNVRPGIYTIVRTLPVASQGCQYRVKNVQDDHERVIDEAQLRPVLTIPGLTRPGLTIRGMLPRGRWRHRSVASANPGRLPPEGDRQH